MSDDDVNASAIDWSTPTNEGAVPVASIADTNDNQAIASQIRDLIGTVNHKIFEIGLRLRIVKDRMTHGGFGDWLTLEFGWSSSTAQRFMRADKEWGEKADLVAPLEASAIYLLTAKATPPTVREDIEARLEEGQRPSLHDIRKMVTEARAEAGAGKEPSARLTKAREAAALIRMRMEADVHALRALLVGADAAELLRALREDETDEGTADEPEADA